MIKVVHCQREPFDVYIGRGKGSILGNPYTHLSGKTIAIFQVATREEAISRFKAYAWARMFLDKKFCDAVLACDGKTLGCWCKPKSCHGDCFDDLIHMWRNRTLWT